MWQPMIGSTRLVGVFCVVTQLWLAPSVAPATVTVSSAPVVAGFAAERVSAGAPTAAGAFVPVAAARIVDSRAGLQVGGPVPGFGVVGVQVAGRSGYLQVWPAGAARPETSNLNFPAGQTIATTVIVPAGAGGRIEVFNGSPGDVDLLVDVTG